MKNVSEQVNETIHEYINTLTPEQKQVIKNSTLKDWLDAVFNLMQKPDFWTGILVAACEGVADGIRNFEEENYY